MSEQGNSKFFSEILPDICKILDENIPNVVSILLIGSYARGHGSFLPSGVPSKDIDLAIIVEEEVFIDTDYLLKKFKKQFNINLIIDLHVYKYETLLNVLPLFRFYDLKQFSLLLWGREVRQEICNFNDSDISHYDGFRFLAGELTKIMKGYAIDERKLYFVKESCKNIAEGNYSKGVRYGPSISINEYINYCLGYYSGGYKEAAKKHLLPTVRYILRNKIIANKSISVLISYIFQFYLTAIWAFKEKNIFVLRDWRDPGLRILYSIVYYYENKEDEAKRDFFKSISLKEYTENNIIKCYENYFQGNSWKSIRKSNWQASYRIVI